jgi:kinetochor protein Mis14/NSL1
MGDAVAHRKIELQSPDDLIYLINNVRKAAADSINAAFPPVEGGDGHGEDELRVQIEKLVEEVCLLLSKSRLIPSVMCI